MELTISEDQRIAYLMEQLKKHETRADQIKVELRSLIYKIEKGR